MNDLKWSVLMYIHGCYAGQVRKLTLPLAKEIARRWANEDAGQAAGIVDISGNICDEW